MQRAIALLAFVMIGLLAGCQYAMPAGYVKVEAGPEYRFRAMSADASAITLRTEGNPENGDLAFWEKAARTRLTDVRGYRLADRKETSCGRLKGVQMSFDYEKAGVGYAYVVLLFVDGRKVHCIEIAGVKDKIAPQLVAIREAVGKWSL
jgi:hypothetical protein